ncbi:hypothetical protein POM88_034780 [Heracleum sosnowskyi]|uniref:RING-type E3 ubiquitin transferase n=1 Tax=Heracleum sosnowskyi TaxID=360622 RepID=A0AAD8MDX8_9APIA|nr:hypothetical protein POM88_034780 [Heracleum sosnowskyi]
MYVYSIEYIKTRRAAVLLKHIWKWCGIVLKSSVLLSIWIFVIPILIGLLFELLVIVPMRVPIDESPVFLLYQDWALGLIFLKIWTRLMSSEGPNHDELDFEFLGNISGESYLVQTNVYINGSGNREQRHTLWFDPTTDFHTYSFFWNHRSIIVVICCSSSVGTRSICCCCHPIVFTASASCHHCVPLRLYL